MNKWKIAFWSCFTVLILVTGFGFYAIIDQAVTSSYLRDSYRKTEYDFENLIKIINKSDLTKEQIENRLKDNGLNKHINFKTDTVYLNDVLIIFDGDKFKLITRRW